VSPPPPPGRFLPLHEPAPLGPDGKRDGCRYAYARGTCRSPRAGGLWCERHEQDWRCAVQAQGGALVLAFEVARVEPDSDYFSPERQAARDAERKRVRAEQLAASRSPTG
jgi:hypothetical protein